MMETFVKASPFQVSKYIAGEWKRFTIGYKKDQIHKDFKFGTVQQSSFMKSPHFAIVENKLTVYFIGMDEDLFQKGLVKLQKQMVVN